MMNKEIAKAKAKCLRSYLSTLGFDLNYSRALEAVARMEGETSYNTLQSKLVDAPRLTPIAESLAVTSAAKPELVTDEAVEGFLMEDLDPHNGFMPAYRKGRLVVSTAYNSNLSMSYLAVRVYEVDLNGEQLGNGVCVTCTPLRVSSDTETRRQFVCFLAESLGSAEFASLSVGEMREALESFCTGHVFVVGSTIHAAILERLRSAVAAKASSAKSWDIEVCRKEMADVTVIVHNATPTEAENEAIGEASSRDLDAHETDYLLADDDLHADEPKVGVVAGDDGERASWEISVRRISYGFISINVEGVATKELAEMQALDEANEYEFFNTSERHIVKTLKKL